MTDAIEKTENKVAEVLPQTRGSDRYELARALLAEWDSNVLDEKHSVREYELYEDLTLDHGERAITLLREFITPPNVEEGEAQIVESIMIRTRNALHPDRIVTLSPEDYQRALNEAVRSGVQLAALTKGATR